MDSRLKQHALRTARSLGVLGALELARERWSIIDQRADNERFCEENPGFIPPPLSAMHDAYGSVSFRVYWSMGQYMAQFVADLINRHHPAAERVLEWGCGPARILRHLPPLLPSVQLFGADYNKESIAWCRQAISNISFAENEPSPPLPFGDRQFDVIYAVSVLTHLSIDQQIRWIGELRRVAAPHGCLILTTLGERAAMILLPDEQRRFQNDGAVVRDRVEEGKRCFLAYTHPTYAREHLFNDLSICEHLPGVAGAPATEQDIWILKAD